MAVMAVMAFVLGNNTKSHRAEVLTRFSTPLSEDHAVLPHLRPRSTSRNLPPQQTPLPLHQAEERAPIPPSTMSAPVHLTAHYTSPGCSAKDFIHSLPELSSNPSTANRTAYLSKLRAEAVELQSSINAFLTQKMEEDNVASVKPAVDDAKEEENYGEEVVEEDG